MSRSFAFVVPGQPAPQGAIRPVVTNKGRLAGIHGNQERLQPWREAVAWEAVRARGAQPIPFPEPMAVSLYATFRMRRPKRPKAPWPVVPPDLSHLVRAVEDALSGIIYSDDKQIVHIDARQEYAEGEHVPGVTIVVSGFTNSPDSSRHEAALENQETRDGKQERIRGEDPGGVSKEGRGYRFDAR